MQNALKSNEWQRIWIVETFNIEIQKWRPNNLAILQDWFPGEIRSPLFNFWKFENSEKSTPEWCGMHWNLMNDEEFRSFKLLKLKYRKEDRTIQLFWRTGFPNNYAPLSLLFGNLKTHRKVLLNHAECIEI